MLPMGFHDLQVVAELKQGEKVLSLNPPDNVSTTYKSWPN